MLNVYLLSGVIQNQYWRHLDPAAPSAARAESFFHPDVPVYRDFRNGENLSAFVDN